MFWQASGTDRGLNIVARLLVTFVAFGWVIAPVWAAPPRSPQPSRAARRAAPTVVYPKKTEVDFEGAFIEGEIRAPGEFYFQRRAQEKFDSLVKRRPNFRREMMRDVVIAR